MVKDMTKGNPFKLILIFAIPMFIGNIFQQFYNVIDSIVVGNFVGSDALAAVGACTSAYNLIIALTTGLTTGMSVVVAQAFGAHNYALVKKAFINSTIVNLSAGLIITFTGFLLARPLLTVLNTPPEVIGEAYTYLMIMFAGTLATCVYNGMASVLRALGNSLMPLLILIMASILNVCLDLLFVIYFGWGVGGVAIATILSQLISAIFCVIYAFQKVPMLRFSLKEISPDPELIREVVRIGVPAAVSTSIVSISSMFMQRAVNAYGSTVMAAYTVGLRVEQMGLCLCFSIGTAVAMFCGQNIGAHQYDRVKQGMRAGYLINIVYSVTAGMIMFFGASRIAAIFISEAEVIAISVTCIRITVVFAPVLGFVFIFQNFLRSAGDVRPTVYMSLAEVTARGILPFIFSFLWGYTGIWWATPVGWIGSVIIGYIRYLSGKWKGKLEAVTDSGE